MTNYVKTTNFSAKDSLAAGDPNKRITGAGHDTEYDAIETASATKANLASPTLTGTPTVPTAATGTDSTQAASTAYVQAELGLFTGPFGTVNLGLATAVASNALTIDVRTQDLGDATATDQVTISFRNSTATTGDYNAQTISGALDITVPDGATLGFTNSETGFVYVYAIDNGGTVEMAVAKKALFEEGATLNTTVLDTSSDSADVLYSTTARTGVPIRLIGRLVVQTGATAGQWGNAPTVLSLWQIGMKRTGDIVQVKFASESSQQSGATALPSDNTIPQDSEGNQALSTTITPTDALNDIVIHGNLGPVSHSNSSTAVCVGALFASSQGAGAIASAGHKTSSSNPGGGNLQMFALYAAGATSADTIQLRFGQSGAVTARVNTLPGSTGAWHSTCPSVTLLMYEIQA